MKELHECGVEIIMDDFGMGHSSMSALQNSPFDVVKLDGSLVRGITENTRSTNIVSSIFYLSKSLHFTIIAEYVETIEQRDQLACLGCRIFQGYLYSPAVPIEELIPLIDRIGAAEARTLPSTGR